MSLNIYDKTNNALLQAAGEVNINDTAASENTAYSSTKVQGLIDDTNTELKNLRINDVAGGKNLFKPNRDFITETHNGITFTNNLDGTFTVNGTCTANYGLVIGTSPATVGMKLVGTPSGTQTGENAYVCILKDNSWASGVSAVDYGDGAIVDSVGTNDTVQLVFAAGVTVTNVIFKPMITTDLNATYDDFEPWINSVKHLGEENNDIKMLGWSVPAECPIQNYTDSNGVFHQRVGRVDMGTLSWEVNSGNIFYANLSTVQRPGYDVKANIFTLKYTTQTRNNFTSIDDSIATTGSSESSIGIFINDADYTDASALKSALSGTYLYYELATEVTTQVDGNEMAISNFHNFRRTRNNITNYLGNLSKAIAEQNLGKYGYTIGDYFIGASGYYYYLADMDTYYGGYNSYGVIGTHHCGVIVDTKVTSAWLSSGSVGNYSDSTLHTYLTGTALTNIKSDLTTLLGDWSAHMLSHSMLDNAVGSWGTKTWVSGTYIEAPSECQMYGSSICSCDGFQQGISTKPLSLFQKFRFNEIFGNVIIWLKSICTSSNACSAYGSGYADTGDVTNSNRVCGLIYLK